MFTPFFNSSNHGPGFGLDDTRLVTSDNVQIVILSPEEGGECECSLDLWSWRCIATLLQNGKVKISMPFNKPKF